MIVDLLNITVDEDQELRRDADVNTDHYSNCFLQNRFDSLYFTFSFNKYFQLFQHFCMCYFDWF